MNIDDVKEDLKKKNYKKALISIEKIWERMKEANKGKEPPQFMSTHPSSDSRIRNIQTWLNEIILKYPPLKI